MKITSKHYEKLYNGEKVSRKAKKAILGKGLSTKKLRQRITNVEARKIEPFDNGYYYYWPSDEFCPKCGCEVSRTTDNMAEYPEEYIKEYCLRCDELLSCRDNGFVQHALLEDGYKIYQY